MSDVLAIIQTKSEAGEVKVSPRGVKLKHEMTEGWAFNVKGRRWSPPCGTGLEGVKRQEHGEAQHGDFQTNLIDRGLEGGDEH